ncbi:unnamed protein product, partial [Ranitomeya imitator]
MDDPGCCIKDGLERGKSKVESCERPREVVSDRSWDADVEVGLLMGMLKSPRIRVGSSEDMKCGSQAEKWSRKRMIKDTQPGKIYFHTFHQIRSTLIPVMDRQVEPSDCPGVDTVVDRLQQIWTHVVDNLTLSQEKAQRFANRRRCVGPRLRVGDLVWLSSRHVPMKVSSPKFKPRFIGPYKISEVLNPVSFRLDLPASFAIHNVFHRSLLRRYVAPMVPSVDPPAPVLVEGELEYVVEKILDSRVSRRKLQYLVKWKGYGQEDNSWVFASDVHAADLVRAFHLAHPDRPGGSGEGSVTPPQGGGTVVNSVVELPPVVVNGTSASSVYGLPLVAMSEAAASEGLKYPLMKSFAPDEPGQILLLDLKDRGLSPTPLRISEGFDTDSFNPHGMSLYIDEKDGTVYLFVVNHPHLNSVIEIFRFLKEENSLIHLRTVRHKLLNSVNDVVAVGPESFYATTDYYFDSMSMKTVELAMGLRWTGVVYYSPGDVRKVVTGFYSGNGIAMSNDKKFIYAADIIGHTISVYKKNEDWSLTPVKEVDLDILVDNLSVDPATGDIWIGAHPNVFKLFMYNPEDLPGSEVRDDRHGSFTGGHRRGSQAVAKQHRCPQPINMTRKGQHIHCWRKDFSGGGKQRPH